MIKLAIIFLVMGLIAGFGVGYWYNNLAFKSELQKCSPPELPAVPADTGVRTSPPAVLPAN